MKSTSNIISITLIGGGVAGFVLASRPLIASKEVDIPLNVLGINRSPYGEVFAMAMQDPIGTYFNASEGSANKFDASEPNLHGHKPDTNKLAMEGSTGVNGRARHFIEGMVSGLTERTNPRASSPAHKFYLRRGIEDKLRFAYNLDPGHYGNYNSYHFFLTEPELGTRPELTPLAAKLADQTISYCLSQRDDPRKALTAASAAGNIIELMLNDRLTNPEKPNFTTNQMKVVLGVMDQSIGMYNQLANEWTDNNLWSNLSELRLREVQERLSFVLKIRDSHEKSIHRLEGVSADSRALSQSIKRVQSTLH